MWNAFLFFFVFLCYQLFSGLAVNLVLRLCLPESTVNVQITALCVASAVASLLTLVTFFWTKWCPVSRAYLKSKPYSVLFWAALLAVGLLIPFTWLQEMLPDDMTKDLMQAEFAVLLKRPEGYLVISLIAPLVEEVVFRGAILRALIEWTKKKWPESKKGVWLCIVLSALLFSVSHLNPAQMPHAFVIGILLGWMYWRTGSVIPGIMYHWVNNTAAFVIVGMFPTIPYDAKLPVYFGGDETAVIKAVIFSLLIALPSLWQLHVLMKKAQE